MTFPYSDNIIFFDTEFTHLDPKIGSLLSIGFVKYSGEELYLEFEYDGPMHPWVKKNVIPHLNEKKHTKTEARKIIQKFFGKNKPYLMAYVNQFDAMFWYELFGSPQDHPAFWIPIDFAAILFGYGYDPNSFGKKKFFSSLNVDKEKYHLHNALDDARLLSETYKKFFSFVQQKIIE